MKKALSVLALTFMFFLSFVLSISADGDNYEEAIAELIDKGYEVIASDGKSITFGKSLEADNISQMNLAPYAWAGYSARNFKLVSKSVPNLIIKSGTIARNGSNTFTVSYTGTTTVSGSIAIGAADINATLGLSSSSSITISD